MKRLWHLIEAGLGGISLLALTLLILLPSLQVLLRNSLNSPITGLEEATRWGLIILVFSATPLLVTTNGHIRLSEFIDLLPGAGRIGLERLTLLLSGLTTGMIAWAGVLSVAKTIGTRTPSLDIPFYLFAAPMLIGLIATAIGYIWLAIRTEHPPLSPGIQSVEQGETSA